jgi:hypothetical protein
MRKYHSLILPNVIPPGYRQLCRDKSEILKIPLDEKDHKDLFRKSYIEIYEDIVSFFKQNESGYKALFCREKDLNETKFGLNFLRDRYKEMCIITENKSKLAQTFIPNIFYMESLVTKLSNVSKVGANHLLDKFTYMYSQETTCDFHDHCQVTDCALGAVKRSAYLMSDAICKIYNVELTPNHVPVLKSTGIILSNNRRENKQERDPSESKQSDEASLKKRPRY